MLRQGRCVLLILTILVLGRTVPARAARYLNAAQIKAGLQTTVAEEEGFVERVMINVDRGKVPRSLVESTFDWARRKPPKLKFQYFKRGLILRAQKAGIRGVDVVDDTQ